MTIADQRILRGVGATLSWQNLDADGQPAAPPAAVTIGVVASDGTIVVPAGTATAGSSSDPRTYTLAASANQQLDFLTATWTVAGGSAFTTHIEVVGGYYFTVGEARASDPTLADEARYPTADILAARADVEDQFETICGLSFVPRFRIDDVNGQNSRAITLERGRVRSFRRLGYEYGTSTTYLNSSGLADLRANGNGVVFSRFAIFPYGLRNVHVSYEHGLDRPPPEVKTAALIRLRHCLNYVKTGIPDRATTFQPETGFGTFNIATAGVATTGIPEVDAVLARYKVRAGFA